MKKRIVYFAKTPFPKGISQENIHRIISKKDIDWWKVRGYKIIKKVI